MPASVQLAVLDQGSLRGCRDASAGCIGRVKKAMLGRFRRGWALAMHFSLGPWYCDMAIFAFVVAAVGVERHFHV